MSNGRGQHGPRLAKQWDALPGISIAFTGDATSLGGSLPATASQTILRMMGEYTITPTAAPAAGDEAQVTIGIGVVSTDAFAAGAGSVPDPTSEAEYPWLYWASHPIGRAVDASVDPANETLLLRKSFDVKSMRKMKPRESLIFVAQYFNFTGDPPLTVLVGVTRVLLGLH